MAYCVQRSAPRRFTRTTASTYMCVCVFVFMCVCVCMFVLCVLCVCVCECAFVTVCRGERLEGSL